MKLELQLSDLDEDGLDLTSLIDVLFLLLTFFILAATFVAPAMEVELARAKSLQASPSPENPLTFSIDAAGLIYFERRQIDEPELKRLIAAHNQETSLIFNVDQRAPFESFLTVLDEAKSQGKRKVLINGQPKTRGQNE